MPRVQNHACVSKSSHHHVHGYDTIHGQTDQGRQRKGIVSYVQAATCTIRLSSDDSPRIKEYSCCCCLPVLCSTLATSSAPRFTASRYKFLRGRQLMKIKKLVG